MASVRPVVHTSGMPITLKSGVANWPAKSARPSETGTCTRWVALIARSGETSLNSSFMMTPKITTTSGPGTKRIGPSFGRALSHQKRKTRLIEAMISGPAVSELAIE